MPFQGSLVNPDSLFRQQSVTDGASDFIETCLEGLLWIGFHHFVYRQSETGVMLAKIDVGGWYRAFPIEFSVGLGDPTPEHPQTKVLRNPLVAFSVVRRAQSCGTARWSVEQPLYNSSSIIVNRVIRFGFYCLALLHLHEILNSAP